MELKMTSFGEVVGFCVLSIGRGVIQVAGKFWWQICTIVCWRNASGRGELRAKDQCANITASTKITNILERRSRAVIKDEAYEDITSHGESRHCRRASRAHLTFRNFISVILKTQSKDESPQCSFEDQKVSFEVKNLARAWPIRDLWSRRLRYYFHTFSFKW